MHNTQEITSSNHLKENNIIYSFPMYILLLLKLDINNVNCERNIKIKINMHLLILTILTLAGILLKKRKKKKMPSIQASVIQHPHNKLTIKLMKIHSEWRCMNRPKKYIYTMNTLINNHSGIKDQGGKMSEI